MRGSGTPIRRAQLVTPFGVGAMVTGPDGISVMTAGLDAWFRREGGDDDSANLDPTEFRLEEWRLERYLNVREFRLPPDYRQSRILISGTAPNTRLTVPMVRFPQIHFCRNGACARITKIPLYARGRKQCPHCNKWGLAQVPFVAICASGHIQDFPFREWVHRSLNPSCLGAMRLRSTGGSSLGAQVVECDCGKSRTLAGITEGSADDSHLTSSLSATERYTCPGHVPWHGTETPYGCGNAIKGSLRSASNVYYAVTRSSIYLPQSDDPRIEEILELFESHAGLATALQIYKDTGLRPPPAAGTIRNFARSDLEGFTDPQIQAAIDTCFSDRPDVPREDSSYSHESETEFRRAEFQALREPQKHPELESHAIPIESYGGWMTKHFAQVILVDRLRETRALVGFERIVPEMPVQIETRKKLLSSQEDPPDWLPAALVYGEGIFLTLPEAQLQAWESQPAVLARLSLLQHRFDQAAAMRGLSDQTLPGRLPLLHTLAHILINQLIFECGYSSASLRERLYISHGPRPMAGLLIYTAAGDSEGTMGGLVRMGRPEYFTRVVGRAIEDAVWCSADPVCMEIGGTSGQGPDSCNMAACHNCALVPETACELFNRFLDRGLVVGSFTEPDIGFFEAARAFGQGWAR